MKATSLILLAHGASAAAIQPRNPQIPDLSKLIPDLSKIPPGGDLSNIFKDLGGAAGGPGGVPPALLSMAPVLPRAKVASRVAGETDVRAGAKRTVFKFGPYELLGQKVPHPPSFSLDPKGQGFFNVLDSGLCDTDCTILRSTTNLVFADGSLAGPDQGVYVHHLLASDMDKKVKVPVLPCDYDAVDMAKLPLGTSSPTAPFISQGEDNGKSPSLYTSLDGTFDSGFHVRKSDKFLLQADLVNYNDDTRDVYIQVDVEYLDGIQGKDATNNLMSVVGCKFAQPALNRTGVAVTTSKLFPILVNGTLVAAKGHMHNGGEKMVLRVNGQHACDSRPSYVGESIHGMSVCNLGIKIKPGDSISMDSVYDLATHPLRKGVGGMAEHDRFGGDDVMGMWTLTFAYD